jgi:hypothetical protein
MNSLGSPEDSTVASETTEDDNAKVPDTPVDPPRISIRSIVALDDDDEYAMGYCDFTMDF